jgi:hypothetical protein
LQKVLIPKIFFGKNLIKLSKNAKFNADIESSKITPTNLWAENFAHRNKSQTPIFPLIFCCQLFSHEFFATLQLFNGFEISIKLCVFYPDITCGETAQKPEKLFYQRVLALNFRTINSLGKPRCSNRCTLLVPRRLFIPALQ